MYRKKNNAVREAHNSGGTELPTGTYKARAERVPGWYGSRRDSYYCLRAWDNITQPEERGPTLFMQPTSRGSGDCLDATNSEYDQDATEEALSQSQARESVHALWWRTSESRVRENRMHGLMREGRWTRLWLNYWGTARRKGRQQIGLIYGAVNLLSTLPLPETTFHGVWIPLFYPGDEPPKSGRV